MRRYYLQRRVEEERQEVEVTGRDLHYLSRVLRLGVGESFDATDTDGRECRARIVRLDRDRMVLEAWRLPPRPIPSAKLPKVHLFQCLPKAQKMDIIVRQATEAGVAAIVPVRSARTVAEASGGRLDRWRRIGVEALQQCGRIEPPVILPTVGLADLARSGSVLQAEGGGECALFFHEDPVGAEPLHRIVAAPASVIRLLIGPEGGLSPEEVLLLTEGAWRQAYLGPTVLRTETATVAALGALAILLLERETWSPSAWAESTSLASPSTP